MWCIHFFSKNLASSNNFFKNHKITIEIGSIELDAGLTRAVTRVACLFKEIQNALEMAFFYQKINFLHKIKVDPLSKKIFFPFIPLQAHDEEMLKISERYLDSWMSNGQITENLL